MKKVIKYTLVVVGSIILTVIGLLILASLLLQTRPVKNKLARVAENQAGNFLNGQLSIGKIDGNFFTGLVVEDILLTYENDTVAFIEELDVSYNLRALLNGTVDVPEAAIENPYFYLEQYNDSTWNVQKIIKPVPEKQDTTPSKGMNLRFSDISISSGKIAINSPDTTIPQEVNNLNTQFSVYSEEDELSATLNEFRLSTVKPDFEVNQLEFEFHRDSSFFKLNDFQLKTAMNRLTGKAEFESEAPKEASAHFESEELKLQEFSFFLPDLTIPAQPVVKLDAEMNVDSVRVILELKDQNQQISLNAFSSNLAGYLLNKNEELLDYQVQGTLDNVVLGHWVGDPELDYLINGKLSAGGRGIDPASAEVVVQANLGESTIENKKLQELIIDLELYRGNLSGLVQGKGDFGNFRVDPEINNLLDYPVYEVYLETGELNLAQLLDNDSLSSNINLTAQISGESFKPEQLTVTAEIKASESRFQEIQVDTLYADAKYSSENLRIDTLMLQSKDMNLTAGGNYAFSGPSDIRLTADFEGTEALQPFVSIEEFSTSGRLQAHLTGTMDSLTLNATLDTDSTIYQEMTLDTLHLDANAYIAGTDTIFDAQLTAYNYFSGGFQLDSIQAQVEGNLDSLYITADVSNDDLSTEIETGFVPGEKMRFTLNDWIINYKNQHWALQQTPAVIQIDSTSYRIDNFRLATNDSDSAQFIFAEGLITRRGEEDFVLEVGNINLNELAQILEQDFDAQGVLDLNLNVEGTAGAPLVKGDFNVNEAQVNEYSFTNFDGSLNYADQKLEFKTLIVPQDSGKIDITATLPMQFDLDTMGYYFNPEDSIKANVVIDSFSLAILETLNLTGEMKGYLQGNVDVGGTVKNPDPKGNIRLVNASVNIDQYGVEYDEIKLNLKFLKKSVQLDTLHISSEDGSLTGTGSIDFSSVFYKGDVSESQIELDFDRFNLLNHNQFNMQVTGNASLGGEKGHVVYGGDLKIPQAEIYLPAVLSMMGKLNTAEMPEPILVRHAQRMDISLDSLGINKLELPQRDTAGFDYFDELEGQLRIRIPRNTWIKNEDMRIEISGELELIKNEEFFELFGSVEVVRGQYDLLGKTFVIEEGSISFQGGEEMMPRINITAVYTFRNPERAEQELTVKVTGTAEEPEVEFLLDGGSITEGDALSYILFGKSMDALTLSEQQNMENAGGGSLAERAAASVISSQLTDFLGERLNVDYIEVKSEGSFDNASVVVGKYITNDLFVSYEQRFGEVDEKDLAKYEVTLEYQLLRFLFLELNNSSNDSGFDVIVKFDVK